MVPIAWLVFPIDYLVAGMYTYMTTNPSIRAKSRFIWSPTDEII